MEDTWPQTGRADALIALGIHWREARKTVRGLRFKMRQYGEYYYQQCWRGVRLRFRVILEEPIKNP